ncbi:hypothetical protein HaLaN_10467 [Haematococcus lacustris]|uniref:Uncharacterized protein n=1 Tax=Haematococcus lacustris TaxID=44745 RepID=A0A699YW00_HAELA|nr:hypothetical protein HaLaN_10467 [Haematococcus lacustris]
MIKNSKAKIYPCMPCNIVANVSRLHSAMKGKKRKDKPDDLGWVGPVSPQGRALKERLKEAAKSRLQIVKCYLKGFIRDCNAALILQRAGESKWRPLELCRWQHRARLPAQGKEYQALGFKKLRERAPKAQAQQPVAQ